MHVFVHVYMCLYVCIVPTAFECMYSHKHKQVTTKKGVSKKDVPKKVVPKKGSKVRYPAVNPDQPR